MNVNEPIALLAGLSPATFMQRHWHKKPLVIRQAMPGFVPPLDRADLIALAAQPEIESRLIVQGDAKVEKKGRGGEAVKQNDAASNAKSNTGWKFRHGPFARAALPPFKQPGWTVLLQGMDLHDERMHALMNQFRFIPGARLDDLMVSYATDGGGVGPHFDSYDVFLLQAYGQRRWRIGRQKDLSVMPSMPLKVLANFEPEEEFTLGPGDMLYLPPRYAHDGVAVGECMTYSIGFRAPKRGEIASELLQRLAEDAANALGEARSEALYRDPKQAAVEDSGAIPQALVEFAQKALSDALKDPLAVGRALGEYLTEPKAWVSFDGESDCRWGGAIRLDRRSRVMYDSKHIFINGESYLAAGRDANLLRALANQRYLIQKEVVKLSEGASTLLKDWQEAGWLHADD